MTTYTQNDTDHTTTYPAAADDPIRRPMIDDSFGYLADRLDRLEHVLGNLNGVVMRAGAQLEPVLTDGTYGDLIPDSVPVAPTPEDHRSAVARRIDRAGRDVDRLADITAGISHRLEAILDAVEL